MIVALLNQKGGVGKTPELARHSDHIVIDGPPRVAALLRSALLAADLALIPAQPSPFDGWASAEMLALIAEVRVFRPRLRARFVLNRCPAALAARIGQRIICAEAAQTGQLVFERDDGSLATREIATLASAIERLAP
jgi:chromosome partitioning protein